VFGANENLKGVVMAKVPGPMDEAIEPSHVGSLYGPITRIRDAYRWGSESFALEKFKAGDHGAWRKKMVAEVFEAMKYSPAKGEFAAETVERTDCGKYFREKIYFNTTPELRVPAYVLVPKGLTGKAPAIVSLHDHGGFYRWGKEKLVKLEGEHPSLTDFKGAYAGRSIADDLAEQGYVVIVIDMFFWGERRLRLPEDVKEGKETKQDVNKFNASRQGMEQLVARTIFTSGFTWAGVMFWDDIRTVDYLVSRPEVDAERIGCVGLSLGAWRTNHLMALDERVKAGVAVCWLSSFKELQSRHVVNTVGLTKVLPGMYRKLDMPDVVSLAAPRALLNINGTKDGLFPVETGVKPAYRILESVYGKIGAGEKFRGHLYEAPHEFNAEMQVEAWAWLRENLKHKT
jgi:dienelactone hydrolase